MSRPARQDAPHHVVGAAGPGADATARGVRAAAAVAVGAVVALHVLRSGTDPRSHRLSEYATGAWGWLMVVAFGAAAVAAWLLRGAVPEARGARAIRWLLALAAAGLVTSAAVPTDATATVPLREAVHSLASTAATIALTAAAVWWVTLGRAAMARSAGRVPAMVAASVAVVGVLVSPAAHDGPWTGLVQRLTWLALAGWLALAAGAGVRRSRR